MAKYPIDLHPGWYVDDDIEGIDRSKPGIYEWVIEGAGSYIGRYGSIKRPTRHYRRNVVRLLNGLGYRNQNPLGYRLIHHAMAAAVREGRTITLRIVENPPPDLIGVRELALIKERGALNGTGSTGPAQD